MKAISCDISWQISKTLASKQLLYDTGPLAYSTWGSGISGIFSQEIHSKSSPKKPKLRYDKWEVWEYGKIDENIGRRNNVSASLYNK